MQSHFEEQLHSLIFIYAPQSLLSIPLDLVFLVHLVVPVGLPLLLLAMPGHRYAPLPPSVLAGRWQLRI